jgi:hypothetical protein
MTERIGRDSAIDANEFKIISINKLLEVRDLLTDILEAGESVKLRVEEEEVKPQENHEGK